MTHLAAPAAVQGITGGHILGAITLSGLALGAAIALILGVRGSDIIKIDNKKKAAWWGIITGTLFEAAGGTWADVAQGISDVPKSALGAGSGFGDPGLGGTALAITLLAFGPKWKRMVWPALLGIAGAVVFGQAGGAWGILVNVFRMAAAKIVGGA
ncbi:hypothetical protein [Streptomyces sp. RTd22]|uniref:hypothetical protein n=1 Tax=Streptomyces sp. RTd22 TaxID=1841249 RepID=UPI0007C4D83F|nr:hypothetical protein [Streptomyces sp. RTd22]